MDLATIAHDYLDRFKAQQTPKQWVAQCQHVGQVLPAFKYLSRYLYRGVISNKRIIHDDGDFITFEYVEAQSGDTRTRRMRGEDFLRLILQHTLPKGFSPARRVVCVPASESPKCLTLPCWILVLPSIRNGHNPITTGSNLTGSFAQTFA